MKCPHCTVDFHDNEITNSIGQDADGLWRIKTKKCSSCLRNIYYLENLVADSGQQGRYKSVSETLIRPKVANRPPVPKEVPAKYSEDYLEACLVIADSPKASSALSRRSLQLIIREKLSVKKSNLFQEIQEVIDKAMLPSDLLESIDAVRTVGNFAAHPIKSTSTGEIVPVEPHEADWNLEVIEMLFEYLFVRPEAVKKRRAAQNAKLKDAGKPPMQ